MDLGSPEKSVEETNEEDQAAVVGKHDLNLFVDKDVQSEQSFGHKNEALNGEQVDSNQDHSELPVLPLVNNNEEVHYFMKSMSTASSPHSKEAEDYCLPFDSDADHYDTDRKNFYDNTEGRRFPSEDYDTHNKNEGTEYVALSDELHYTSANETINGKVETDNLDGYTHNTHLNVDNLHTYEVVDTDLMNYQSAKSTTSNEPVDGDCGYVPGNYQSEQTELITHNIHLKDDNVHTYEVVDTDLMNYQRAKSPTSNEPVDGDHGYVLGNCQPEQAELMTEEMDGGILNHNKETKEDCFPLEMVQSDKGELEKENSDLLYTQRNLNATLVERQVSISPERSPHRRPSPEQGEQPFPENSDPKTLPSPSSSKRKRSLSPQRHAAPRKRASSRDRLSPSLRRKSPSERAAQRDSHHRDNSPRKRLSASPRRRESRRESPRRRDRSASRSPARRDSSAYRRDHRGRSRSRSPYARDRYRRSPRRRHSPRRRSPPSGYHSRRRSPRRPWSPPSNRNTGVGRPGKNLFVAGFSYVTTEKDLERKFSKFGRVTDVRIVRDRMNGDSRGFGFLSLERDEDADAAIRALDQTEWNGRIVLVEKSKSSVR